MRKHLLTIFVALVIAVVLILYLVTFQLPQNRMAVVTTFGQAGKKAVTEAGLHWRWPKPIQRVHIMDGRLHSFEGMFDELLTKDDKPMRVLACLAWRIKDPLKFLNEVETIEKANERLSSMLHSSKQTIIARYDLENLVSTDPNKLKFDEMETDWEAAVKQEAADKLGIEVALVRLKRFALPEYVIGSIYNRMKTEREEIAARYIESGRGEASRIKTTAENARQTILNRARAEAEKIRAEGDAKAAKYYAIFRENPELAIFLRELKTLEKASNERTTFILDDKTAGFRLLNSSFYPAESEEKTTSASDTTTVVPQTTTISK